MKAGIDELRARRRNRELLQRLKNERPGPAVLVPQEQRLSRREHFAAEAMKVLLANALLECDKGKRGDAILESVESSFFIADLMVKEAAK